MASNNDPFEFREFEEDGNLLETNREATTINIEDEDVKRQTKAAGFVHDAEDEYSGHSDDREELLSGQKKSAPFWTFEYYQKFFDIETHHVRERILGSLLPWPRKNFIQFYLRRNPDLYGPFWICTTLVFAVFISGNISNFMAGKYNPQFRKVTIAATMIFSYAWFVPLGLWGFLLWRNNKILNLVSYSFMEVVCVYGYSLSAYIPAVVLCIAPLEWLRWCIMVAAFGLSGSILVMTFWPALREDHPKVAMAMVSAIVLLDVVLAVVCKVLCWRAAASVAWSVLLLPASTAAFVVLSKLSVLHPVQMFADCVSVLLSAGSVFSFLLLAGVIIMVGFLTFEYYTVVPSIACSKVALLGQLLHPRQLLYCLAHGVMGVVVGWSCAVTIGYRYERLAYLCPQQDRDGLLHMCLNEHHLLLLLEGGFVGLSHSLLGVIQNLNYVSFGTVQQHKYLCFKASLPLAAKCSAAQAFYSVRNFVLFYFFLGHIPRAWMCKSLSLQLDSSAHPLDSISGLLDLSLLYLLWISATYLLFSWYMTLLLFRIFVTEAYSFPVQSTFTEEAPRCLPKVLSEKQPMILKFLALQDLSLLSQHSPSRRSQVFSLSQPGGHPHNWNAISQECLSLLADLTQRLVSYHETVATNGRTKSLSSGSDRKTSSESSGTEDLASCRPTFLMKTPASVFLRSVGAGPQSPLTSPFTPDLDSPFASPTLRQLTSPVDLGSPWHGVVQSPHVMRRAPKLWSTSTDSQRNGSPPASPATLPTPKPESSKPSFLAQFFQNRREQVKHFMAKRMLVMYLFTKLPEASSQALFADGQAHIWALDGLSYLVQASFTEDQFGVVQTTLPSILSSMLLLQEAVDRHFKLPHASSKPVRSTISLGDSSHKTLRFALRATLKTAIYRITTTFGAHLHAVQLSAEHRKRLQHFLEYKE